MSYAEWENKKMSMGIKKKCILMRGIPGTGKSYRVKELLRELGATTAHVFSTDSYFSPVTNKIRELGHASPTKLDLNKAIALCEELIDMWYGAKWSEPKRQASDSFNVFKAEFDRGEYYAALNTAEQMADALEAVEYKASWNGPQVHKNHIRNHLNFKAAVDLGITPVIVDNTNIRARDLRPYAKYATDAGYEVTIEEPGSPHWKANKNLFDDKYGNRVAIDAFVKELGTKNTHGVPYETLADMANAWKNNITVDDVLNPKQPEKKKR